MPFPDLWPDKVAEYRSRAVCPADFDAFWAATLAELRAVPLDARFELVEVGLPVFDVYDVTFAGFGGHAVKGWYIAPKGGAADCVVKYIGYNGGRAFPHEHLHWPATGRAVLVMDTRGQGAGWAVGATADPVGSDPAQAGFMTKGIAAKESYFYRRVYCDAVQAVAAARSFPGVARVAVTGGSQGGGIALAVAGLMEGGLLEGVWGVMPDVPYLCDFARSIVVAARDPYLEIARYLAVHRDKEAAVLATLSYFDGVHFAARATAPALFSVALMDTICPPTSVYGAYHAYGGPKEMAVYTYNDHEGGGAFQELRQREWLAAL